MRLQFLGANQQVTGSRYHLRGGGLSILIDCGLFQERCCLERNWEPSPVPPEKVDVLLLTHAHLDHSGLIPKFVQEGFSGDVLATAPSIELAKLVLEDAGRIQEEDAAYKKKRHQQEGRRGRYPEIPLYTATDAKTALRQFRAVEYNRLITLSDRVRVRYHDAGHILGSATIELLISDGGRERRLLFSGDIGQWDSPLMHDPSVFEQADVVVMESTYGDRSHKPSEGLLEELAKTINDTVARRGNLVIPTFAIDRAQDLLHYFSQLVHASRIPRLTVFLDSPMAIDATRIYKDYKRSLDEETQQAFGRGINPFQFSGLHLVRNSRESRAINSIRGSCIILAGSGMCTGGRVKHHLRQNISREESTILFVGYQAADTLGRQIVDGATEVRIHGQMYEVKAQIAQISGFSAHADQVGLLRWLQHFESVPERLFLTHGEAEPARALSERIREELNWETTVPDYKQGFEI